MAHPETAAERSAMFADFGTAATYTPLVGAAVAVTVIDDVPVPETGLGEAGFAMSVADQAAAKIAFVRRDQVAAPAVGAMLTIGATVFTIRAARLDESGQVWRLDLVLP